MAEEVGLGGACNTSVGPSMLLVPPGKC